MILDPFQQKAIDFINEGFSVIVSAPTGAGKTVIAEHVIEKCLTQGTRVIYTAPIKALSNQKFRDFDERFPGKVGLLTGDVTINPESPALIMTTEIFRNKILEEKNSLFPFAWVIFDEIHYIDDYERGSVWEESLMFLPEHMNILGLSATVPNVDELANWFQSIHRRPLKVIKENKRPVPLHLYYQCQNEIYDDVKQLLKRGFYTPRAVVDRYRRIPPYVHMKPNKLAPLIKILKEDELLPCIYFVFSRKRTEFLAEEIKDMDFLTDEERERITGIFDGYCQRFDLVDEPTAKKIRPFVEKGIAYHHAGMLPTLKEVVERLFTSRLIKMIFTTETFALGINMPARTVVFDELSKYYGQGYDVLKTRDFYQMAGRAGRRGIDSEGFVFCRINPHDVGPHQLQRVVFGPPEEVRSRFNAGYATLLNLYQKYEEKLYDIYPVSFHYFQEKKRFQKMALEMMRDKVNILKQLGYIRKNKLTDKGLFASKVYGYEFVLSELYDNGTLEKLSPLELAVLSIALVFEPRKGYEHPHISNKQIRRLQELTDELVLTIQRMERKMRIKPLSKRCYYHLALAMEAWMRGQDFDTLMSETDVDEGEVVRYFRMSIQILREILDAPVSDSLKDKVHSVLNKINRDIINAEKQLRS